MVQVSILSGPPTDFGETVNPKSFFPKIIKLMICGKAGKICSAVSS